ncbi:hypothetical protein LTR66_002938 [Elasticomyces elasticus]|nr:hypothetical protein LTR66_002938 [Elasticomyces elasticus]
MLEIPSSRNGWRLDVVSILAVLGESNIKINAHLITASWTCLLPRLMPAPQGLLAEKRMKQLPYEDDVVVTGIKSGNKRSGLNYFASVIHGSGAFEGELSVQEYTIEWKGTSESIRPRTFNVFNLIAVGSFLLSVGLLVWSIVVGDGVAFMGIIIMSFATPFLCIGSKWTAGSLPKHRPYSANIPDGDVAIRARNGAFVVVHCREDVSRALYFAPNDCHFALSSWWARAIGGIAGGLTLTVSIILFGNSSWVMQAALAVSYAFLNVVYWSASLVEQKHCWDLSDFDVRRTFVKSYPSFTEAVWQAIYLSGDTEWMDAGEVLPKTQAWNDWLREAQRNIDLRRADWDPRQALIEIFQKNRTTAV